MKSDAAKLVKPLEMRSGTHPGFAYEQDFLMGIGQGEGSFSLPVTSVDNLGEAIRMKLLRELLSTNGSENVIPAAAEPPTDCLAGEKERARRTDQYFPELDR